MKDTEVVLRTSVRGIFKEFTFVKGDRKMEHTEVPTSCFSARNFLGIYFLKKETVK